MDDVETIRLRQPITVRGQQIILIQDEVMPNPQGNVVELTPPGEQTLHGIYADEEAILPLRDRYPGVPVYGLWQTLLHSRAITDDSLQILCSEEDPDAGYYALVEDGRLAETGDYVGGQIAGRFDVDLGKARTIPNSTQILWIPPRRAVSLKELREQRRKATRSATIRRASYVALGVLGGIAASFYSYYEADQVREQNSDRKAKVETINRQYQDVIKAQQPDIPVSTMLAAIVSLVHADPSFEMEQDTLFSENAIIGYVHGRVPLPGWVDNSQATPDGRKRVQWVKDE